MIVDVADMNKIKNRKFRDYKIDFVNQEDFLKFKELDFNIVRVQEQFNQVTVRIDKKDINKLLKEVSKHKIKFISEVQYTLSSYFKERRSMRNE